MTTRVLAVLSAILMVLGAACSGGNPATGSAELLATTSQALSQADATTVTVTISAPDISPSIVQSLVKTAGTWQGTIGGIPVGTNRTLTANAYDSSSTVIYSGAVSPVTITKGTTAMVAIVLQQVTPPPAYGEQVPIIDSLVASTTSPATGDIVTLVAAAHDANPNDVIAYAWSATGGSFGSTGSASTTWTAPATDGVQPLTVSVTDSHQETATLSVTMSVAAANGKGSAGVTLTLNTWPVVSLVSASPTLINVGQSAALTATASDADGNPLTYAWTSACAGTFGSTTTPTTSFTLGAPLPPSGTCTLTVAVSDGMGGSDTGSVTVATGAGVTATLAPVIGTTFQSASSVAEGATVTLQATASDPQASALNFAWGASGGMLGRQTNTATSSGMTWTAPSSAGTWTVTLTVTDALGASSTVPFTIQSIASPPKVVFVSSQVYTGNLGGLTGADADCQALASSAGLTGTYKAWLSSYTVSAASRLAQATVPYVLVNGTVVASNWASLTSATLLHAIDTTEKNGPAPTSAPDSQNAPGGCGTSLVWTNTRDDGSLGNNGDSSCSGWTNGSSLLGGGNGSFWGSSNQVSNWSSWCAGGGCDASAPLFCIQQ